MSNGISDRQRSAGRLDDRSVSAVAARAGERAENLRAIVVDVRNAGFTSVRSVAEELNRRAILTPRRRVARDARGADC
jgi:hypothetical protein